MTRSARKIVASCLSAIVGILAWPGLAFAADVQQVRSPGGMAAWLVQERSLPIITIRFAFDGGSAQEPAGKEGTAGLLAARRPPGRKISASRLVAPMTFVGLIALSVDI